MCLIRRDVDRVWMPMDIFAFGQMYIYWLGLRRRKTALRATYSRRYPENIYRPSRRENKRFFWELASYDDLSARFNGVPSVAVRTLNVDSSLSYACIRRPPNSLSVYTRVFMAFSILFHLAELTSVRKRSKETSIFAKSFHRAVRMIKELKIDSLTCVQNFVDYLWIYRRVDRRLHRAMPADKLWKSHERGRGASPHSRCPPTLLLPHDPVRELYHRWRKSEKCSAMCASLDKTVDFRQMGIKCPSARQILHFTMFISDRADHTFLHTRQIYYALVVGNDVVSNRTEQCRDKSRRAA